MNIPGWCVKYPVTTMVGVILAVMFGAISLLRIPVQMKPTIDRPVITVETRYDGAAPLEVEEEVSEPVEQKLTSVEGLTEMTSRSEEGRSRVILEFDWGTDKDIARLDVSEKMGLVRNLPDDADRSTIRAVNSDAEDSIAWIVVDTKRPINEVRVVGDDVIRPKLERVPGVGAVFMFGGEDREVRITLDYEAMNARGITVKTLREVLIRENQNTKGGKIDEGKRRYVVRTVGNFTQLEQLLNTIVARQPGGAVYLRDIAKVEFDYEDVTRRVRVSAKPTIAFSIRRRTGANTLEVMTKLKETIKEINRSYQGRDIKLRQVYDETDYILQSRGLVVNNIFIGGALAIGVLLLFLGSMSSVVVVAVAIPVAVISTFIFIFMLGRSINIISLAGLAFAVGMVVDNSIVVLENIFRHREMGKDRWQAAVDGGVEVWGAVLASTLTTLAVFLPVIFVEDESGQLFRDIAIAISVAVGLSLIVSVTVVPMLSSRMLRRTDTESPLSRLISLTGVYALGSWFREWFVRLIETLMRGVVFRVLIAVSITVTSVFLAWYFFPPIDYLPKGNRNLMFVFLRTPPGLNIDQMDKIMSELEGRLTRVKELDRFFAVVRPTNPLMGLLAKAEYSDKDSMRKLTKKLFGLVQGIPGIRAFVTQVSLFRRRGSGFIGGINLNVDVTGDSLEEIQRIAGEVAEKARRLPGVRFANSSFDLGNPELQIHVDREKAADLGLSVTELGDIVETLVNGTRAGLFRDQGKELDIVLRGSQTRFTRTQELSQITLYTPDGRSVQLSEIAEIRQALGPTKIEHIDRYRSVTLTVNLADELPLQIAIERMRREVIDPIRAKLPLGYSVEVGGRAKDLERTWNALKWSFLLALVITYLLMAALFEAWSYPLIIMFSVPLASTGGVLAVSLMNYIEPSIKMDTLVMLGFIILTGIVVNNAILLVHQALNHFRSGMEMRTAILESVRDRMRPIFMTMTTTVLGMLPLVVSSGSGSELYRGLGAAVLGGLATSTIFTLILIPVIFSLWVDFQEKIMPARFNTGLRGGENGHSGEASWGTGAASGASVGQTFPENRP
ncbi:MAG: efflux RND transporter permease subunit [Nitrospinaceae bacterium]|jgi:hydrophobic/amphiphilic exporter-1 (mainly G- bacteria), HAE1 family|nr:efflux RND transporter permease subunit [Nitrospinaceae bacterium]MBT4095179.1 efflux RND transporter permease subunit [Nitrospinaceae bacterium]MBT5948638.1 efflux RND transporter permease subunit [Nitrospinaceae bacterium]MBT6395426.1 efflux RND transporter permease subunit [Nitrospinaceae bacterium]MBT7856850.1 efflux RND transporter permease subunit [Nitrospinaceae bacterium]